MGKTTTSTSMVVESTCVVTSAMGTRQLKQRPMGKSVGSMLRKRSGSTTTTRTGVSIEERSEHDEYANWQRDLHKAEVDQLMASRIGGCFGSRQYPRVTRCSGNPRWWRPAGGPYRTARTAFRTARKLRQESSGARFGVVSGPVPKRRKRQEWWIVQMIRPRYKKT